MAPIRSTFKGDDGSPVEGGRKKRENLRFVESFAGGAAEFTGEKSLYGVIRKGKEGQGKSSAGWRNSLEA